MHLSNVLFFFFQYHKLFSNEAFVVYFIADAVTYNDLIWTQGGKIDEILKDQEI